MREKTLADSSQTSNLLFVVCHNLCLAYGGCRFVLKRKTSILGANRWGTLGYSRQEATVGLAAMQSNLSPSKAQWK